MVLTFVDLGVGVAELDGDIPLELVLEANGHDARDGLYDGRFAMRYVADGACALSISYDTLRRRTSTAHRY